MKVYHISGKKYRDLRPLAFQRNTSKQIKFLKDQQHSKESLEAYTNEIFFFLGEITKSHIDQMVKAGFENWDNSGVYVYEVDLSKINLNYIKVKNTQQWYQYLLKVQGEAKRDNAGKGLNPDIPFVDRSEEEQEVIREINQKYIEKLEGYLEKYYKIKPRMTLEEFVNHELFPEWSDFERWFKYNLKHGDKKQYATHIPHVAVSVNSPIKFDKVTRIDR